MKKLLLMLAMLPGIALATDNNLTISAEDETSVEYTIVAETMKLSCDSELYQLRRGDRVAFKLSGALVEVSRKNTQIDLDLPAVVIVGESCKLY